MAKKATTGFYFKMSEEQRSLIEQKMAQVGILNMSAYIRKMCIDGQIFVVHIPELREIIRLLRITTNNVNQIAKRVNSGGEAAGAEVEQMRVQLESVWDQLNVFIRLLTEIP